VHRFKHYNYDQKQLQLNAFKHAVHYLIERKPDLPVFSKGFSTHSL
jgi:hypothetical protein